MLARGTKIELRGGALRIADDLEEHEEFMVGNTIHRIGEVRFEPAEWVEILCEDGACLGVSADTVLLLESGRLEAGALHPGHILLGFRTVADVQPHSEGMLLQVAGIQGLPVKAEGLWIIG